MPVTEGSAALPADAAGVKQMGQLGADGFLYFPQRATDGSTPVSIIGTGTVGQGAPGSQAWPVAPQQILSTTSTLSNVGASATSVQLLAANTSRVAAKIVNDSDKVVRIKYGATASASSYTDILAPRDANGIGGVHVIDGAHTGRIDAIWESGPTGNARVTELT